MDHGLCFVRTNEELTHRLSHIDKVQDEHLYGLFPKFRQRLNASMMDKCAARLREMDAATAEAIVASVPNEWEVSEPARRAWSELIYRRASYVADNVEVWIDAAVPWFGRQGE